MTLPREARNKTQQRISHLLELLRENSTQAFTYADLMLATGMAYDTLLYVLHTLEAMGHVTKEETPDGPGRPKVTFQWASTRTGGVRRSA